MQTAGLAVAGSSLCLFLSVADFEQDSLWPNGKFFPLPYAVRVKMVPLSLIIIPQYVLDANVIVETVL